ncbi:GNAT family N-acetyltransferase [Porticoccus sp.]
MLTYHSLDTPPVEEWLELLNSDLVRKHLIQHPQFTTETLGIWLQSKIELDQEPGCRLRAIHSDGMLIGWCGIQVESGNYEVALVLSPKYWGHGRAALNQVIKWAQELGHKRLLAHLPPTRSQKKALERLFGQPIGASSIQGHIFNTYQMEI